MNKFTHLSYQQSDEDYQADFDYNDDKYVDENDILAMIDSQQIHETISRESQSILNTFWGTRMTSALTTNARNPPSKSVINTGFIMTANVYKSLYNMHPSDAIIFQISVGRKML